MRNFIVSLAILATAAFGQVSNIQVRATGWVSTLPTICVPGTTDMVFLTAGAVGPYYCDAQNHWAAVGTYAGAPGGSNGNIQANILGAFGAAQLDASIKTHMADEAACWTDDLNVIQRRYEASVAQKKAASLKKPVAPDVEPQQ